MNNFRKNARHLFLMVVCFIMVAGVSSCNKEESMVEPQIPTSMDDASLLKFQMEKFINTRSTVYDVALVTTTTTSIKISLSTEGTNYTIDWGDGVIENNGTIHFYKDGEAAHTIFIYGTIFSINVQNEEIIFADISRVQELTTFHAESNRISNIDLSNNTNLFDLRLGRNALHSIDLTSNKKLITLDLSFNPINSIDVSMLPSLRSFSINTTNINFLDISQNTELFSLEIDKTKIPDIDLSNCPSLDFFGFEDTPISCIDLSKNTNLTALNCCKTNITQLDFSNNPKISCVLFEDCKLDNLILPSNPYNLRLLKTMGSSLEQNMRKIINLAMCLPDCNVPVDGFVQQGIWETRSPYASSIISLLDGYNWDVGIR